MSAGAPALLDVNVLVALFDPHHIHHDAAHDWFEANRHFGWATCPITESAFVRVLSDPAYGAAGERAATALDRLRAFCESGDHQFWRDALSLRDDVFDLMRAGGHGRVTSIYLLGLAVNRKGRLATFDRSMPLGAVKGATAETLALI
ncbi:MAG: TA system VapC family ribonuclease toxin [Vicinamibacterales bacterium]